MQELFAGEINDFLLVNQFKVIGFQTVLRWWGGNTFIEQIIHHSLATEHTPVLGYDTQQSNVKKSCWNILIRGQYRSLSPPKNQFCYYSIFWFNRQLLFSWRSIRKQLERHSDLSHCLFSRQKARFGLVWFSFKALFWTILDSIGKKRIFLLWQSEFETVLRHTQTCMTTQKLCLSMFTYSSCSKSKLSLKPLPHNPI